jgi:hypothetical protein
MFRPLLAVLACWLALPALAAFTDNGDGTITDTVTGLMWDKCSWGQTWDNTTPPGTCTGSASTHNWAAALNVAITANGSSHRAYTDWRLPNRTELESLVKIDTHSPAIDTTAFPNTPSDWFWTSTTYAPNPAGAWNVVFDDGDTNAAYKTGTGHVRLVRSGQSFASFDSMGDVTAPVLSSVGVSGTTSSATTLAATSDEAATGYWLVVARDATAPTSAQVKAGANYGAVTKVASGNAAMTANVAKNFSVTGLAAGTNYDLYFAAEDGNGNLVASPTKVQFTTTAATTPPVMGDVPNQTPTVGVVFSLALAGYVTQTDGNAITGYRIATGALPAGLSLNTSTGAISGTPSAAGMSNVTVQALDADGWSNSDAITFTVSAAADTTPDAFSFTDQTNVARATLTESNAITVAGIDAAAAISVTGGEYQIDGGGWTSGAGTVNNGASVKVRHTSSASYSTATNTVLTIGGVSDTFSTTTEAAPADTTPDAFSFTDQTNVARATLTESNAITVAGIDAAAAISVAGGEYQIDGGGWTSGAGTVNNGASVKVRHTSSASYSTATNTVLTIGGVSDTFSTTTEAAPAPAPDPAPPAPTAVYITGPNQTLSPTGSLPVELASGVDASGTTINLPADKSVTLKLGNLTVVVSAQGASARLVLAQVTVDGRNVTVARIAAGTVRVAAQDGGQPLLLVGDGTVVSAGGADARIIAAQDGDGYLLSVSQGFVVLPGASMARQGKTHRAASPEFSIYAGERATLDADGQVSRLVLGTDAGGAAGDPLSLDLPDSLSIAAPVPNLAASAMRLGGPVQTAIAEAAGGTLAAGQDGGVLVIDLEGQRFHLLPLGEVTVDPERRDGVVLNEDGTATVSAAGIGVRVAPGVASLARFAADLEQALPGARVAVNENGAIVATVGETAYVVRADWVGAAAEEGGFATDAAGRLSYGQLSRAWTLHPAFADHARLAAAVAEALPGATVQTNSDGTVTVRHGAARYTLTPANMLETAPAGSERWWIGTDGKPRLRNADGTMQEFRIE